MRVSDVVFIRVNGKLENWFRQYVFYLQNPTGVKYYDQKQLGLRGEFISAYNPQVTLHHRAKSGQEPEGRN